jgi:uncharacterized protein YxeA
MKYILIILVVLMSVSCTKYTVKKEADGSTEVYISSTRDLDQPEVHYSRTGKDATFDFKAASVDNNTDAFLGMFQGMMSMMMQMMQAQMTPVPQAE